MARPTEQRFDPTQISGPSPRLLKYYLLVSIFSGPFFPVVFLPLFFKYETLRYRFDESGVSMSWGILFRREVHLTYRRIQDIHLTRNLVQRWIGLATVGIQTASGSSGPEMSIEGILESEELRDFLYAQMRGARGEEETSPAAPDEMVAAAAGNSSDEALALLHQISDSLRKMVERQGGAS